jgi:hypothetical protein
MKVCEKCSALFKDSTRGQQQKYCSKRCRSRARDARQGKGVISTRPCSECKTKFTSAYRRRKYCSKKCSDAASFKHVGHNRNREARDYVYEDKITQGCSRCPERRPSCLQYHHIDPLTKKSGIGRLVQGARIERVIEEMKKCILLCANCHFIEENGDGYRV